MPPDTRSAARPMPPRSREEERASTSTQSLPNREGSPTASSSMLPAGGVRPASPPRSRTPSSSWWATKPAFSPSSTAARSRPRSRTSRTPRARSSRSRTRSCSSPSRTTPTSASSSTRSPASRRSTTTRSATRSSEGIGARPALTASTRARRPRRPNGTRPSGASTTSRRRTSAFCSSATPTSSSTRSR